jgi:hypothetical protein
VKFAEQPASTRWAALKHQGSKLAEVWFKPEGEPLALVFRIPQITFQSSPIGPHLTLENLLKSVGIASAEVASWRHGGVCRAAQDGAPGELKEPLLAPASELDYLEVHVTLRPPPQELAPAETAAPDFSSTREQDLEARWNSILGLEASIDGLRIAMEGVRVELETAWKKPLTPEERLHALRADVHQLNKAKTRVPFALPKVREFVHRATWVMGTPERKVLGEAFKNHLEQHVPLPEMDRLPDHLESLLKERQVLSAQGVAVQQECRAIASEMHNALTRLQNNAAINKRRHRAGRTGGKFFKDIRRLTMGNEQ